MSGCPRSTAQAFRDSSKRLCSCRDLAIPYSVRPELQLLSFHPVELSSGSPRHRRRCTARLPAHSVPAHAERMLDESFSRSSALQRSRHALRLTIGNCANIQNCTYVNRRLLFDNAKICRVKLPLGRYCLSMNYHVDHGLTILKPRLSLC